MAEERVVTLVDAVELRCGACRRPFNYAGDHTRSRDLLCPYCAATVQYRPEVPSAATVVELVEGGPEGAKVSRPTRRTLGGYGTKR